MVMLGDGQAIVLIIKYDMSYSKSLEVSVTSTISVWSKDVIHFPDTLSVNCCGAENGIVQDN